MKLSSPAGTCRMLLASLVTLLFRQVEIVVVGHVGDQIVALVVVRCESVLVLLLLIAKFSWRLITMLRFGVTRGNSCCIVSSHRLAAINIKRVQLALAAAVWRLGSGLLVIVE